MYTKTLWYKHRSKTLYFQFFLQIIWIMFIGIRCINWCLSNTHRICLLQNPTWGHSRDLQRVLVAAIRFQNARIFWIVFLCTEELPPMTHSIYTAKTGQSLLSMTHVSNSLTFWIERQESFQPRQQTDVSRPSCCALQVNCLLYFLIAWFIFHHLDHPETRLFVLVVHPERPTSWPFP